LEIVAHFSYLRIVFSETGKFNIAKKELVNKGIKTMYEVSRKGRIHNLSTKCQLDLFDKIVKPILLYGCENWGFL
jgi:phosphotransacetylase